MSDKEKCPKCGAARIHCSTTEDLHVLFDCRSYMPLSTGRLVEAGSCFKAQIATLTAERDRLLGAVQASYRKHHMMTEVLGWEELSSLLRDTLCESMGDREFQAWIGGVARLEGEI